MTVGHTRVIPRPSERRRHTETPDLVIIDDAPSVDARHHRAARDVASAPSSFLFCGWIAAIASALAFGWFGLDGRVESTLGLVLVVPLAAITKLVIDRFLVPRVGEWIAAALFAGFGLRLLAAVPRLLSGADAYIYQQYGELIAQSLRSFEFAIDTGRGIPGTGAVRYFAGIVNVFTFSNFLATYLVFVVIAFAGSVFLLLGVQRALTASQFRLAAALIAFSPTMMFWPSSMGKESISIFGIGVTFYGASRLYDRQWSGALPIVFGVFAVGMVRPHVAVVVLSGLLIGLLARESHTRGRLASHSAVLIVVLLSSMWAVDGSAGLFGLESLDGFSDVSAALDFTQERTSQDSAEFTAARVRSVTDYPLGIVTVLFRPFPWEVSSGLALISAIEGMVLFGLALFAIPGCVTHVRQIAQRGQLLFAGGFTAIFVYLFAAIGNFGILTRQRSQVIPFVLIFVAFGVGAEKRRLRLSRQS